MAKKIQDLKPDIVLKNYWRNNEQFADLFNAVLFDGEQVIKPEELEDIDTEESTIFEHRDYAEAIKEARDNIKVMKRSTIYGVEFAMLGKEGQEHIHYAMPMRLMGYDYGTYKKQYDNNAKKYKTAEGVESDEYLSRMKKLINLYQLLQCWLAVLADIIYRQTELTNIVVYYGEKPWDGATTLHDMLDIPKRMKRFVNDYKMLLVEARKNDLKLHNVNNKDLFNLLQILLDKSKSLNEIKENVIDYSMKHRVDRAVIMTVAGAARCKVDYNELSRKGDLDMCTVFEETRIEGK